MNFDEIVENQRATIEKEPTNSWEESYVRILDSVNAFESYASVGKLSWELTVSLANIVAELMKTCDDRSVYMHNGFVSPSKDRAKAIRQARSTKVSTVLEARGLIGVSFEKFKQSFMVKSSGGSDVFALIADIAGTVYRVASDLPICYASPEDRAKNAKKA